jgi:5'-nucleotidase
MSADTPLFLVTNDDGIDAKGVTALVEVAKEFGEVLVVAPNKPQSGMGHAITINAPLRLFESDEHGDTRAYSCSGTPVDCVKLAIYHVLKGRPTMVLSGINHGSNCSINVIYSGTMSAAIEGALEGIPSIGFSLLNHDKNADFECSKVVVRRLLKQATTQQMPHGLCLNVNIPNITLDELKGIKVCRQGQAHWEDDFDTRTDPHGADYHWMRGEFVSFDKGDDTDMWALENNYVSVVPTQFDLTAHHAIAELNNWEF